MYTCKGQPPLCKGQPPLCKGQPPLCKGGLPKLWISIPLSFLCSTTFPLVVLTQLFKSVPDASHSDKNLTITLRMSLTILLKLLRICEYLKLIFTTFTTISYQLEFIISNDFNMNN